jgi:Leucine-rich repeat (LRR) protein
MAKGVVHSVIEIINQLSRIKSANNALNKADIEREFAQLTGAEKRRSVFVCADFAFRFSEANKGSFSNVVLSLSALQKYDNEPFVVCVVRPDDLAFLLANSTFLKKISHSSHNLTTDNVRGSFLGHDIFAVYDGIQNVPENFEILYALHEPFTWEENLERLVAATNSIAARSTRFEMTPDRMAIILDAPARSKRALSNPDVIYSIFKQLDEQVHANREALLDAAALENVNIRGNKIEQIITGALNKHNLDDLIFETNKWQITVDIKTKLLDRASAPKAYNVDKMLRLLAMDRSVFEFFFIGLHAETKIIKTALVSIFDPTILRATRIQTHWAGRNSRGVTQLTGDLMQIFDPRYRPSVDEPEALALLRRFAER